MKIRAGQYYKSRDGIIYGPMKKVHDGEFSFVGRIEGEWEASFREDGSHCDGKGCSYDLVALYIDWQAVAKERLGLLERVFAHADEFNLVDDLYVEIADHLRIEREPDPEDDAAQRADHDRKVKEES